MKKMGFTHKTYYISESVLLLVGFLAAAYFSSQIKMQIAFISTTLVGYIVLGVIHHKTHHNLKIKIVVEYLLVALLVASAFLFLNSSRL